MIGAGGDGGACATSWPFRRSARLQGKEARAAPGRAGDRPRDRRQAGIGLSLPDIAVGRDRDGVAPALIVADQHGADLEVAVPLRGTWAKQPRLHAVFHRKKRIIAPDSPSWSCGE